VAHFREEVVFDVVAEAEVQSIQYRVAAQAHGIIQWIVRRRLRAQEVVGEDVSLPQGVGGHERDQHREHGERAGNHCQGCPQGQACEHLGNGLLAVEAFELFSVPGLNPQHQLGVEGEGVGQEQVAVPGAGTRGQFVELLLAGVGFVAAQGAEAVRVGVAGVGVGVVHYVVPLPPELRRHQQRAEPQPTKEILPPPAHSQRAMQNLMGQQRLATNGMPHQQSQPEIGIPRQTRQQNNRQPGPDNRLQRQKPDHPPGLSFKRISRKFLLHPVPEFPFIRLSKHGRRRRSLFHCCVHRLPVHAYC